jgi:hypothetical protein
LKARLRSTTDRIVWRISRQLETIMQFRRSLKEDGWKMIDSKAKLLAVLDTAEKYRGLAIRAKDRGERETYERIVELYVKIAEELEALIDGRS